MMILALFAFAFVAAGDPRIEEECHIPVNPNNTDNEVKLQNCNGEILVKNNGNADGRFYWETESKFPAGRLNFKSIKIRGDGAPAKNYKGYKVATDGAACAMVTRNYANGAYNYTEYATQNWALSVQQKRDDGEIKTVYSLKCINGRQ
jgi:hypothetical protein